MKEVITMLNHRTPCDDKENNFNCPYGATYSSTCEYYCSQAEEIKILQLDDIYDEAEEEED